MTYRSVQLRLLSEAKRRIHNGELTERGLSRLAGISQPHMHNVLKGVRSLSPEVFDRLLRALHLSLLDLYSVQELLHEGLIRAQPQLILQLPFLRNPIGVGKTWSPDTCSHEKYPVPVSDFTGVDSLALARILPDPRMGPEFGKHDIALLDISSRAINDPQPDGLYVVSQALGTALRHVHYSRYGLYLAATDCKNDPAGWELVRSKSMERIVRGRVLWIGIEKYRGLPPHQRGRALVATSR